MPAGPGKKNTPERLRLLLNQVTQLPNVTRACGVAGISSSTLRYWLAKSAKGQPGDGFDVEYEDQMARFHEHWFEAIQTGVQMVEDAYMNRAINGYWETLHHQGRVAYQFDQDLLNLGLTGSDAYLLDEDGKPIPERIEHQDPEVMRDVLRARRRDVWGLREQIDVMHKGGVMVVTGPARTSAELEARARRMEKEAETATEVEFIEIEDEPAP